MKQRAEKDKTSTGLRTAIILCLLCLWLSLPSILNAEGKGTTVTYVDSIRDDEEGKKISFPSSVFVDLFTNEIYIIANGRVIIYTSDLFPLFTLDKRRGIELPLCLTVDAEGNLYVAQGGTKENPRCRISVFNACLKWESDIYFEGFEGADSFLPNKLDIDKNGNIYVAGLYFPGILIMDNQGKLLDILSPEEEGIKVKINSVTVDKAGRIYLVSEEKSHIYVYDKNRKFLFQFGVKGGSSGKLSRPQAIGVDDNNGRLYVVDYMRHTVAVYDMDGEYLFEFGGLGWGPGWFQHPRDISVDSDGRILVADTFNDRIEILKPTD